MTGSRLILASVSARSGCLNSSLTPRLEFECSTPCPSIDAELCQATEKYRDGPLVSTVGQIAQPASPNVRPRSPLADFAGRMTLPLTVRFFASPKSPTETSPPG